MELLVVAELIDAELSHQFKVDAGVSLLDIYEGHVLYGFSAYVGAGIAHLVVDGVVSAAFADEAVLELASKLFQPVGKFVHYNRLEDFVETIHDGYESVMVWIRTVVTRFVFEN